jgi:probable addiction module antidote protein
MARRRKTISYKEILREDLKDPEYAAGYLNAVLEEDDDAAFLVALRDVAEAYGISDVSRRAELNREHVYTLLSAQGNPRLSSLSALLNAVGMKIQIAAKAHRV